MYEIEDVDTIWMRHAIALAAHAEIIGEISVGAVLIQNGKLISYGWNSSIICHDPSAHAEIVALRIGGKILGNYRLLGTTLYVTLEPCMMCIGAIIHARVYRLVCGAKNSKTGQRSWLKNTLRHPMNNHHVSLTTGVLEKECAYQLNKFFKRQRQT
ncbi:tRNA adenosine(34) deaminase TadA [Candidatus Blochmanniella camponoti]|uniref:tRNA-specific adenosine deaminase n=1 Tax=Candidatus Blochmanniella camponoti TaxID=108080 RepID=A0AAE9I7L2_9ENTR|nr:tRNA adenosine(34) deaminase TadA [Candidatus Blochmannia herculeanus]URJ24371.1 tRNA adenosine(34) deaminase TadA [Candidatus Blochmannia herculeanus]URJ27019.1 tRNA adenosine(34) deaminase TadA [Candidatus Blochmannia herculeanus]URJ27725.1 tRNA adenosine(34) deaminase TadA [Candidatus Blochmannia herculeanus]